MRTPEDEVTKQVFEDKPQMTLSVAAYLLRNWADLARHQVIGDPAECTQHLAK